MHDLRKDNKPGFWQLSWQDLTHLLVTPEVLPEDSHQEREHGLAVGTLNTRSRNAVETCPSLHPSCHAQFVRRWVTGGGDCPQLWRKWGSSPMVVMAVVDWQDLGPPKRLEETVIITWEVPQVTIVAGELVQFLADLGNTNSVQTSHTGSPSPETCSVAEGKLKLKHFTTLLTCTWLLKFSSFLSCLNTPNPLLGSDFLLALGVTLSLKTKAKECFWLDCVLYKTWMIQSKIFPQNLISIGNPREGKICHSYKTHLKGKLITSLLGTSTP